MRTRDFPRGELRKREGAGTVERIGNGIYAAKPPAGLKRWMDVFLRAEARTLGQASVMAPGVTVCRENAALLLGADHLAMPRRVHLAAARRNGSKDHSRYFVRHHQELAQEHRVLASGIPVTSHARTAVDCARHCGLDQALVIVSSVLRLMARPNRRHRSESDRRIERARQAMVDILDSEPRYAGNTQARAVIHAADAWAESALEVLSYLDFRLLGLPVPTLQKEVRVQGHRYFVDAAWEGVRPDGTRWVVFIESDGRGKYSENPEEFARERERENHLRGTGAVLIRVTWTHARDRQRMARTVLQAFPAEVRATLRPDRTLSRYVGSCVAVQ